LTSGRPPDRPRSVHERPSRKSVTYRDGRGCGTIFGASSITRPCLDDIAGRCRDVPPLPPVGRRQGSEEPPLSLWRVPPMPERPPRRGAARSGGDHREVRLVGVQVVAMGEAQRFDDFVCRLPRWWLCPPGLETGERFGETVDREGSAAVHLDSGVDGGGDLLVVFDSLQRPWEEHLDLEECGPRGSERLARIGVAVAAACRAPLAAGRLPGPPALSPCPVTVRAPLSAKQTPRLGGDTGGSRSCRTRKSGWVARIRSDGAADWS